MLAGLVEPDWIPAKSVAAGLLVPERFAEEWFASGLLVPDCFEVGWLAAGLLVLAAVLVLPALLELAALVLPALLELAALVLAALLELADVLVFAEMLGLAAGLPDLGCDVPRKLRVRPWSNWRNSIGAGVATSERTPTIDGIFFFGAVAERSRPILKTLGRMREQRHKRLLSRTDAVRRNAAGLGRSRPV